MDNFNVWGVNWVDGMLVTSVHFNQQDDFARNLSRWVASALAGGYGLARAATFTTEPLELQLRRDGNLLYVTLAQCRALLPNGTVININEEYTRNRAVELKIDVTKEKREQLPIYLYASPSEKSAFGDPLPGEELSRHPFQTLRLALTAAPSNAHSAGSGFQIAEIVSDGSNYSLNADFVPSVISTSCGKAINNRMERLRKQVDTIQRNGLAAISEVRIKTKSRPSAAEEETIRGVFLQSEALLHTIGYNYPQIFDAQVGIGSRQLMNFFTGLVNGFGQGFQIYPELREYVRNAQLTTDAGSVAGGTILPELREYQTREYGFDQLTQFFDDTEKMLSFIAAILNLYRGKIEPTEEFREVNGQRFLLQRHGAIKYSFRSNRHYIIVDGVDPRGTEDVLVCIDKKVMPRYSGAIFYLGENEKDSIETATVCRPPVEDVSNPDYWLIQPNEYFPLKTGRLDRLNVIIDGEVDRAALEAVKMNHVAIYSRSR